MREQGSGPEGLQAFRGAAGPHMEPQLAPRGRDPRGRTAPAARAHLPALPSHGKIDEEITHLVSGFGDRTPRMARTQRIKLG